MNKTLLLTTILSLTTITSAVAEGDFKFKQVDGVLELFTSQGCSSCPPADALMGVLKKKHPNKLMLTYGVTIWDRLGWKDRFATVKNDNRQRSYSRYMGLRSIYTPQSVVDGRSDVVGSHKSKISTYLKKSHLKQNKYHVPMTIVEDDMKLKIKVGAAPSALIDLKKDKHKMLDATLWLVKYRDVAQVNIEVGENAGRKINYYNVVGDFTPLGMWEGKPREFTVAFRDLKGTVGKLETNRFAFLLQLDGVGTIISALKTN